MRTIVVPLFTDHRGRVLLCRMAPTHGVFPGQWALPGGGVEEGERITDALQREVREELGITIDTFTPLLFKDDVLEKKFRDGSTRPIHMLFLVYRCTTSATHIELNDEFSEYAWVEPPALAGLELNALTAATLAAAGFSIQ